MCFYKVILTTQDALIDFGLADSINVLTKLNITYIANHITITAKEEVVINDGAKPKDAS